MRNDGTGAIIVASEELPKEEFAQLQLEILVI